MIKAEAVQQTTHRQNTHTFYQFYHLCVILLKVMSDCSCYQNYENNTVIKNETCDILNSLLTAFRWIKEAEECVHATC